MTDGTTTASRRNFIRSAGTAGTAAAALGAAGSVAGQEGDGGQPDYGGWFSDVSNFSTTEDLRGQGEVTVEVGVEGNGNFWAFGPPAIHVDPGTTITWEWTGQGSAHNVVADDDSFSSGSPVAQAGTTFEQTFNEDGIYKYYCDPHLSVGMKGAVVVGSNFPTVDTGGSTGPVVPESAKLLGVSTGFAMTAILGFAYFFMKYGGDYGEE